jgi:hypothetical protein
VGGVISLEQLITHEDSHVLMGGRNEETERKDSAAQRKTAWTALQTLHHILNFNEGTPGESAATNQQQQQQQSMGAKASARSENSHLVVNPSILTGTPNSSSLPSATPTPTAVATDSNIFWASSKGLYRVGPNIIFDFDGRESSFAFPKGVWPPPSMQDWSGSRIVILYYLK